jgi:riboflavin kinase/FMN adenylyltransferase
LKKGDLDSVITLLGHDYFCSGRVVKHSETAVRTGFPTANIELKHVDAPARGVYLANVRVGNSRKIYQAIASVTQKNLAGHEKSVPVVEVHILEFDRDILSKKIVVYLKKYLRPEKTFTDLFAYKAQMVKDVVTAHRHFSEKNESQHVL